MFWDLSQNIWSSSQTYPKRGVVQFFSPRELRDFIGELRRAWFVLHLLQREAFLPLSLWKYQKYKGCWQTAQNMLSAFWERIMDMSNERFSCVKFKDKYHTKYQLLLLIMSAVWPSVHSVVLIAAIKAAVIFSGWLALQGYGAAICQMKTRRVGSRIDLQTPAARPLIWGQCGAEQCSAGVVSCPTRLSSQEQRNIA